MSQKYTHLSKRMKNAIVENCDAMTDLAGLLHEVVCADIFCMKKPEQKQVKKDDSKPTPRTV